MLVTNKESNKIRNINKNKNAYSNNKKNGLLITSFNYLFFFIIFSLLFFNSLHSKCYAIEKPRYVDYLRERYKDKNISEDRLQSIADEERTLNNSLFNKDIINIENFSIPMNEVYGTYPGAFTGAINFRRNNFLLLTYSLRDVNSKKNKQPVLCGSSVYKVSRGFDLSNWFSNPLDSRTMIKWLFEQYEPEKLCDVYKGRDKEVLESIIAGQYETLLSVRSNEVIKISNDNEGISNLRPGDILLYKDENSKIINYGIYLGKDESNMPYALSSGKMVSGYSKDSFYKGKNIWALSYVNSMEVYPQEIDGIVNFISGTKYNYGLRVRYLLD